MNGITVAARKRAAQPLAGLMRSLMLLLGLVLGVGVASAQSVTGVSVSPASPVLESAGSVSVTVTLAPAPSIATGAITVSYAANGGFANGDASPGADFTAVSGQLVFPIGVTSQVVTIPILEDAVFENPSAPFGAGGAAGLERFTFDLSNLSGSGVIGAFTSTPIDIRDNETAPTLSIDDVSVTEGGGPAVFTVSLSHKVDESFTPLGGISNTTTVAADFAGALVFNPPVVPALADSYQMITGIKDDNLYEGTQTYRMVVLDPGPQADIGDSFGDGIIEDNDAVPTLSIKNAPPIVEPGSQVFDVVASHPAETPYQINFKYIDLSATMGVDYTPTLSISSASLVGSPLTAPLSVAVLADGVAEGPEVYQVMLVDSPDYALGDGTAAGLIKDADNMDISVEKGSGTGFNPKKITVLDPTTTAGFQFVVQNNGDAQSNGTVVVDFVIEGGTPVGAPAACDVWAQVGASTTYQCTFNAGSLLAGVPKTVDIQLNALAVGTVSVTGALSSSTPIDTNDLNNSASCSAWSMGVDHRDVSFPGAPYHVLSDDLRLGVVPTVADVGATTTDLAADDDGVDLTTNTLLIGQNYLPIVVSGGAGFLRVDGNGVVTLDGTNPSIDIPVVEGLNWVPVHILNATTTKLGFRLCGSAGECTSLFAGNAQSGEFESYDGLVPAAPSATNITFNTPATLQDADGNPIQVVEPLTVVSGGLGIQVLDGSGQVIFDVPAPSTSFTVVGNGGANTTRVDIASITTPTLTLDGGAGFDAYELFDSTTPVAPCLSINHTATGLGTGSYVISCAPNTSITTINYLNQEPAGVFVPSVTFTHNFSAANDDIILRDHSTAKDGLFFLDSPAFEAHVQLMPTTTLNINANAGNDKIRIESMDDAYGTTVNVDLGIGSDTAEMLPIDNVNPVVFGPIAGNSPVGTCPGDALRIDTSAGAVISSVTETAGSGTISFSSAHKPVTFTGFEFFGNQSADVSLALVSPAPASVAPGQRVTLELVVSNNGPDTARCVKVENVLLDLALTVATGPVLSQGSWTGTDWIVGSVASGASETLKLTADVGAFYNGLSTITASSPESDPDEDNNSVKIDVETAFPFPAKAQPTASVWYDNGSGENLIVGLANGFAGLNSSVLCRVGTFGGIFPENYWRECGKGLPYPLYVNDMYVDDQGTHGKDDDLIYLASWGSAGLYVSDDGGESFTAAEPVLGPKGGWANVYAIVEDVDEFLYISTNHGFVYRSLNNGMTWQQIGNLPEVDADTPWSLETHPTAKGCLVAGTFGRGAYISDDYGFNWEFVGGKAINDLLLIDRGGHVFDLEFDATGAFLYAATGGGLFRMMMNTDLDCKPMGTWEKIDTDVTLNNGSTVTPEARTIAFDAAGGLFVGTHGHGAFFTATPATATSATQVALRGAEVSFVSVSPLGEIAMGTTESGIIFLDSADITEASSTANEDENVSAEMPEGYALEQNYPNPFNPVTTIGFALPQTGQVHLAVFDVLGREVAVLVDGSLQAGQHSVQFDAQGLTTGTYIYRLQTDKGTFAKQLVLMK